MKDRFTPNKGDINPATGKAYAVNPATGNWDDNYWANTVEPQLKARYPQQSSSQVSMPSVQPAQATQDVTSLARQMIQLQQETAQPAISSLQASVPETSARFATEKTRLAGEKEPLKQRYQSLLEEITRKEKVDVSAQERVTSREFGRRGIPLSSGLFDTSLQEAVSPLRQFYTGQTKDVGLAQEEGLRGIESLISSLTGQETEQQRAISNAIAQIQAGGSAQGIQSALALYQQQQQAQQQAMQFALQQQLAERAQSLQEEVARRPTQKEQFATIGEGSTLYDLLRGQPIYTAPKTYKSGNQFGNWE